MKSAICFLLFLLPVCARAQIIHEHTYQVPDTFDFGLVEVDSADWRYLVYNKTDSISLYFLDHSFDRTIVLSGEPTGHILVIARHLFDLDNKYEILLNNSQGSIVLNEDGKTLFSCKDCTIGYDLHESIWPVSLTPSPIVQTDSGVKFIVWYIDRREVYALPGKLPRCSTSLGVPSLTTTFHNIANPSFAYPNPSTGDVRIAYELPSGTTSGVLLLTNEEGREVKRFKISNAFRDILIHGTDLQSGEYFYRIVTSSGAGQNGKVVRQR
ncbi:MAG: T9SS type A sorting domain-containing protein [Candidatus Kapaibacterium sp.]